MVKHEFTVRYGLERSKPLIVTFEGSRQDFCEFREATFQVLDVTQHAAFMDKFVIRVRFTFGLSLHFLIFCNQNGVHRFQAKISILPELFAKDELFYFCPCIVYHVDPMESISDSVVFMLSMNPSEIDSKESFYFEKFGAVLNLL